jgi:hypothetical protein
VYLSIWRCGSPVFHRRFDVSPVTISRQGISLRAGIGATFVTGFALIVVSAKLADWTLVSPGVRAR